MFGAPAWESTEHWKRPRSRSPDSLGHLAFRRNKGPCRAIRGHIKKDIILKKAPNGQKAMSVWWCKPGNYYTFKQRKVITKRNKNVKPKRVFIWPFAKSQAGPHIDLWVWSSNQTTWVKDIKKEFFGSLKEPEAESLCRDTFAGHRFCFRLCHNSMDLI